MDPREDAAAEECADGARDLRAKMKIKEQKYGLLGVQRSGADYGFGRIFFFGFILSIHSFRGPAGDGPDVEGGLEVARLCWL